MGKVVFDHKLCIKCGTCSEVCPVGIIDKPGAEDYPSITEANRANCIQCGQCEAFCPKAAVEVISDELLKADMPKKREALTPEQVRGYFLMRRSIRRYKQQPVDRQTLEQVMDVVRYAPSGVNQQAVRWIIIYNTEEVRKLTAMTIDIMRQMVSDKSPVAAMMNFQRMVTAWDSGEDIVCRKAPHLVIAYGRKENRIAPVDAIIAMSHFDLAAPAFGVGSCSAGYFGIIANLSPALRKAIGIPDDHNHLGTILTGYPQHVPKRAPKRNRASITWK
jgi:nitroreductase/NAD-dependent dihydropyrimidine dehydrogenase PreA subunit